MTDEAPVMEAAVDTLTEFLPYGWPSMLRRDERLAVVPPVEMVGGRHYRLVNIDLKARTCSLEEIPDEQPWPKREVPDGR